MSIDAVLSDKQPIIEELTARLRHVAESGGGRDKGLGLRIVTVQLKEADPPPSRRSDGRPGTTRRHGPLTPKVEPFAVSTNREKIQA